MAINQSNQNRKPRFFSEFLGHKKAGTPTIQQQFITGGSGREIQERATQIGINPTNLQPIKLLPEGGQLPPLSQPQATQLAVPTAPAPITPTPQQTQRQALQRQIISGFQPTEAEQGLQQQVGKIISGRELGLAQLPGQGRGIVSGLIRGQQERLEAQSAARLVPLQRQLAIEQARRQAASDVASKELEFQRAEEKPIQVGERLVQRTAEGGFRTVFEPPAEAVEPVTVSKGASLVDPTTGTVIFAGSNTEGAQVLSVNEAAALNVPFGTTFDEALELNIVPKTDLTTQQKANFEFKLANDFERFAKESKGAVTQVGLMQSALEQAEQASETGASLNAPSQAILVTFQKILDPTSVVRESEYARSGNGESLLNNIQGRIDKIRQGGAGVTLESLREFVRLGQEFMRGYQDNQLNFARRTQKQAVNNGLNIENILTPDVLDLLQTFEGTRELEERFNNLNFEESFEEIISEKGEDRVREIIEALEEESPGFSQVGGDTELANRPQRNNNPGNIKSGGLADQFATGTDDQGHLIFKNAEDGFKALREDIKAKIQGRSEFVKENPTIQELGRVFAEDLNWAKSVASILGVNINKKTKDIELSKLINAIARQEGFFA